MRRSVEEVTLTIGDFLMENQGYAYKVKEVQEELKRRGFLVKERSIIQHANIWNNRMFRRRNKGVIGRIEVVYVNDNVPYMFWEQPKKKESEKK